MTMTTTMNTTSTRADHTARTVRLTIVGEHGEGIILDAHVDASLVERITVIAEQTPHSTDADLPGDRPVDHIVRRAIRFIDCNYASRIDVGEVARRINVDRSHLSRRFHVCTGMTVKQYIDMLRIRQAERLLAGTTMSVTRVAQRCGYASADVLTRRFRAVRQITPAQYRSAMTRPTAPRPETGPR